MSPTVQTTASVIALTKRVSYGVHTWVVNPNNGGQGWFLQIQYLEKDVDKRDDDKLEVQRGRKWYISPWATDSEIFQTMLKAALTSAEHRVREHFLVDGVRAFGPHLDIDKLIEFVKANEEAKRP